MVWPPHYFSLCISECQLPTPAGKQCPCPSFICCILKHFCSCYPSCLGALHKHPPSNPFAARPLKGLAAVRLVVLATLLITLTYSFLLLPHLSTSICCGFLVLDSKLHISITTLLFWFCPAPRTVGTWFTAVVHSNSNNRDRTQLFPVSGNKFKFHFIHCLWDKKHPIFRLQNTHADISRHGKQTKASGSQPSFVS